MQYFTFLTKAGQEKLLNTDGLTLDKAGISPYLGDLNQSFTILPEQSHEVAIKAAFYDKKAEVLRVSFDVPTDLTDITINAIAIYSGNEIFALAKVPTFYRPANGNGANAECGYELYIGLSAQQALKINIGNIAGVSQDEFNEFKANFDENVKEKLNDAKAQIEEALAAKIAEIEAIKEQILDQPAPTVIPVGTVISSASVLNKPAGFLLCDGRAVNRDEYSALFLAIGTTYGVGDNETTFNLPDFRGVFLRGLDLGRGFDSNRSLANYQADDFKAHKHRLPLPNNNDTTYRRFNGRINERSIDFTLAPDDREENNSMAFTDSNLSSTGGSETRPKNYAVVYYIKY